MKQKGFAPILIVLIIVALVGGYLYHQKQNPTPFQQITQPTSTSDETANWKTYKSEKFSISYPQTWAVDSSKLNNPNLETLEFKSPDYKETPAGYPDAGFLISLNTGTWRFNGNLGLQSSQNIQWLQETAVLQHYNWEGNYWVLSVKKDGHQYQLLTSVASDDVWNKNKDTILKAANTLKVN